MIIKYQHCVEVKIYSAWWHMWLYIPHKSCRFLLSLFKSIKNNINTPLSSDYFFLLVTVLVWITIRIMTVGIIFNVEYGNECMGRGTTVKKRRKRLGEGKKRSWKSMDAETNAFVRRQRTYLHFLHTFKKSFIKKKILA